MPRDMFDRSSALLHHSSIGAVLLAFLSGCTTIPPRNPLPKEFGDMAQIAGVENARFWGDAISEFWVARLKQIDPETVDTLYPGMANRPHYYLAISGGGARGAFGAGVLSGWTATGTRPKFTIVTGVSTGALTAPFAFLGPEYDERLKNAYLSVSTKNLVDRRPWHQIPRSDSVATNLPMLKHIQANFDAEFIKRIAEEHRTGRRLFVGTFNLDAGRPVVWDIGEIANSGRSDAVPLIHAILLASASIPVAFPAVRFQVEADGKTYDEIHVDGGVASQVFLYPYAIDWKTIKNTFKVQGTPEAYVIRNSKIGTAWETIDQNILGITGRSIDSLIRTQGIGDINSIFLQTKRDEIDFHLTYIPSSFDLVSKEAFDPEYMGHLFQLGYDLALSGKAWMKTPPGFEELAEENFAPWSEPAPPIEQ